MEQFNQLERREDIFDRIMHLPGLRTFENFYRAHKEVLLYLFFGGVSLVLNLAMFAFFEYVVGLNQLVNNIICWVTSVLMQFFTNRIWVFQGRTDGAVDFLKQMATFFGGRVFTLAVEEVLLLVFIFGLHFNSMAVKSTAQIVVIVLNYVISKFWVFKK